MNPYSSMPRRTARPPGSPTAASVPRMSSLISTLSALLLLLPLGGCTSPKKDAKLCPPPPPVTTPDTSLQKVQAEAASRKLQEQLRLLQAKNQEQEQQLLELRLELAERDSKNRQLQQSLDRAIQEVVNTKARIRNHYSKAGMVTDLAEFKVEMESIREQDMPPRQREWLARARHYLEMADQALAEDNYDGSRYLANQARQALGQMKSLQSDTEGKGSAFPVPVLMETLDAANMRSRPGLKAKILSTLPEGTRVSVTDRQGLWVKVKGPDGKLGWVHFSLLKVLPARTISEREPPPARADS